MAKTFNYGAGIWATKTGSSMAYNDQNDNYKPLPFSVTRDSIATRVNKEGLIEVVGKDKLRIDYTDSSKGVALLEPSRTNLVTYSEDFEATIWTDFNVTLTSGQSSPDGNSNAYLIEPTNSSFLLYAQSTVSASTEYIFSYFFKSGTKDSVKIAFYDDTANSFITQDATQSFVDYGNGWKRIITYVTTPSGCTSLYSYVDRSSEVGTFYAFGAQLEQGSYATSYIPTSGSATQRQSDVANGAGNSEVFNDSEGVLFADIAALANDLTYRVFGLSDGSTSNRIILYYNPSSNNIELFISSGGASQATLSLTLSDIKLYQKVAVKYKSNDIGLWINGFEVGTDTSATMPSGLNELAFDNSTGTQNFYGKTKRISVYDAVLTDAELEALTSYTSFTNMANELNLTIK